MIDEAAQGFSMKDTVDWVKKEDSDILGFLHAAVQAAKQR